MARDASSSAVFSVANFWATPPPFPHHHSPKMGGNLKALMRVWYLRYQSVASCDKGVKRGGRTEIRKRKGSKETEGSDRELKVPTATLYTIIKLICFSLYLLSDI